MTHCDDRPPLRSWLFVHGDSERKLAKASGTNAQALILDLEDSVAGNRLPAARGQVLEFLDQHGDRARQALWVRMNPLETDDAVRDLAAVVAGRPDGIVLPKIRSANDIAMLDERLHTLESENGIEVGTVRIIAITGETPQSVLDGARFDGISGRLAGLTWGAEDLATALGASTNRTPSGEYAFTYQLARSLCLLRAHAAGVQAIDTIAADFRDRARLEQEVRAAKQSGFTGKLCIHPDQVDVVNAGFMPDATEIAHARAVIEAFARAGDAGAAQLDGRMLDRPHLARARRVLALVNQVS